MTRIIAWGARALYLGPAFELSAHRNGVAVFCACLTGDMAVAVNPRDAAQGWERCRTVFIPAGALHLVRFSADLIACLYLDPQGDDIGLFSAAMTSSQGLLVTHRREAEAISLLAQAVTGAVENAELRAGLSAIFGMAQPTVSDERVTRAIARMRGEPDAMHSLATLAQEAGLSESRLRHVFKAQTGVPLKRFRIWNRMGAAIRAASEGVSLTEAAHGAGFSSSAHFSTAFRAMFGLPPSALTATQPVLEKAVAAS